MPTTRHTPLPRSRTEIRGVCFSGRSGRLYSYRAAYHSWGGQVGWTAQLSDTAFDELSLSGVIPSHLIAAEEAVRSQIHEAMDRF